MKSLEGLVNNVGKRTKICNAELNAEENRKYPGIWVSWGLYSFSG